MHRAFPMMSDRPEGKTVVGGALYWVVYVIGLPFFMAIMMDSGQYSWAVFFLYAISFLAVGAIFFKHLKESFIQVRFYPGQFFLLWELQARWHFP